MGRPAREPDADRITSTGPLRWLASNSNAQIESWQRTAGNAAVAQRLSGPVVQRVPSSHHTEAEIRAMTLGEFDAYARNQADWENEPGRPAADAPMPDAARAELRALLEWGRSKVEGAQGMLTACSGMKVSDLTATGMTAPVKEQLQTYAIAAAQLVPTAEVDTVDDVGKATAIGAALLKLEPALTQGVCHTVLRKSDNWGDALARLMGAGMVDEFLTYVSTCQPLLEAPREIDSFLKMHDEAVDFAAMKAQLKGNVRNLHRFEKAALIALAANFALTDKKRPLFLILHSNLDHNGAFHRDPNITDVITNAAHEVLMVEGVEKLADMSADIGPLAATYGQGGKISQVMIAGHGNTDVIQLAGTVDPVGLGDVPFGHEVDQGEKGTDLSSAPGQTAETDAFMKTLFANMANDPNSRIVLNGCLTASQHVNGPLDPDPNKAAAQVAAAVKAQPSLVNYLQDSAKASGSNARVMGANASFDQVALQDPSGNLDIVATGAPDPQLTAPKLDYIRDGREPLGVLRAVLEVWAQDRTAAPPTHTAADTVHTRVNTEGESLVWNPRVIHTLLGIVDGAIDNAEQTRTLADAADVLGGMSEGSFSVPRLGSGVPHGLMAKIFGAMQNASAFATAAFGLTINQAWMLVDHAKEAAFMAALDPDPLTDAKKFVDIAEISPSMATLLPLADAPHPTRAQLKLALLAVTGGGDPQARAFLRAVAGPHPNFAPALDIDGLLDHTSTADTVEIAIGLHGDKVDPGGGHKAAPAPNVDVDRNNVNDLHVESMTATGTVKAHRLNVREQPSMGAAVVGALSAGDSVDIMGSTKNWYAVRIGGRTRFVFRTFVDV